MSVRITGVESSDLFVGTAQDPHQVLLVTVTRTGAPVTVAVDGAGVSGRATVPAGDGEVVVEVPLDLSAPVGAALPATVTAGGAEPVPCVVTVAEPGWTMYLVSHFHYDPVWWNTQAAYTSPWELLSGDATTRPLWERNGSRWSRRTWTWRCATRRTSSCWPRSTTSSRSSTPTRSAARTCGGCSAGGRWSWSAARTTSRTPT